MIKYFILFFALMSYLPGFDQSIPDHQFTWFKNQDCIPEGTCKELFLKVEKDPVIEQFDPAEFNSYLKDMVEDLELTDEKAIIKLKLFFPIVGQLCVNEIGIKDILLSKKQFTTIKDRFSIIQSIIPGKQRGRIVECQGILYLNLEKGKLVNYRILNFVLKE